MKRILFNRSLVFLLMMLVTLVSFGQDGRTITGKVTDANGEAFTRGEYNSPGDLNRCSG